MCKLVTNKSKYRDNSVFLKTLILNTSVPFTASGIFEIARKYKLDNKCLILDILSELCESGLITYYGGKFYAVQELFGYYSS